jgi:hypothetical protein
VAIFTKFDIFVQDEFQKLMAMAEAEIDEDFDEDELEERAKEIAIKKFEENYRDVLLGMDHPPQAIVAVSESKQGRPHTHLTLQLIVHF